jgi:uncharacterized membrane protein
MGENHDKVISILAYIPFLGWIIALILNSDKTGEEKAYNAFHLRQGLGLFALWLIYSVLKWIIIWIPLLGIFADRMIVIAFIFMGILGIMNAYKGSKRPLPLIGETIEKLFASAFN